MSRNKSTLGRALFKSRFLKSGREAEIGGTDRWIHTAELNDGQDWSRLNLKSVTEQNSLDDFLATAELAGVDFESERLNMNIIQPKNLTHSGILSKDEEKKLLQFKEKHDTLLRIPRRPSWKNAEMNSNIFQMLERDSFLEWRRAIAKVQEIGQLMTPFEKNLEFWRQLWRVIEKSDVVMQIVDARNPLLFYCNDLEKYVKEVDPNKMSYVLINKSDFLTERQRLAWLRYFESKGINIVFWSAVNAALDNDTETGITDVDESSSECASTSGNDDSDDEDNEEDEEEPEVMEKNKFDILREEQEEDESEESSKSSTEEESDLESKTPTRLSPEIPKVEEVKKPEVEVKPAEKVTKISESKEVAKNVESIKKPAPVDNTAAGLNMTESEKAKCRILNREELIHFMKTIYTNKELRNAAKKGTNHSTIGLVGYPNVGKSSTLNALLQDKKVAVSETPGKTKHYQTIFVDDELILCDCPGLVFPTFVSTRGELIVNGILPIDQMKDYMEPMNIVLHHIPRSVIEMIYGIQIAKPREGQDPNRIPTAEETCAAYALFRGYMNHKGTPDVNRASRYILKDYVNGKLLYCYAPPEMDALSFQDHRYEISKEIKYLEKTRKMQEKLLKQQQKPTNFDREFFTSQIPRAMSKGGIADLRRNLPNPEYDKYAQDTSLGTKPWKKHQKGKKDKLRRITAQFDKINDDY